MLTHSTIRNRRNGPVGPRLWAVGLAVILFTAACSGASSGSEPPSVQPSLPSSSRTVSPSPNDGDPSLIEGTFDVGGHSLYLKCRGTGSPTVVYLHGAVDRAFVPHRNGEFAIRALSDEVRVCVYDRRNVGLSDRVDAPQRPDDVLGDLDALLAAAGIEPPYLLLGASFGGLVAYLYANRFPDEVAGMVLLDSMFPDEFALDGLFPPQYRFEAFDQDDETRSIERISHYKMMVAAQEYIGHEPAMPVTYLSSIPEGFDRNNFGIEEYNARVLGLQEAYVNRFAPGKYVRVQSPHFMEAAIPDLIVEELRSLIAGT